MFPEASKEGPRISYPKCLKRASRATNSDLRRVSLFQGGALQGTDRLDASGIGQFTANFNMLAPGDQFVTNEAIMFAFSHEMDRIIFKEYMESTKRNQNYQNICEKVAPT